jgi:ketosteroid isomerase-like protein
MVDARRARMFCVHVMRLLRTFPSLSTSKQIQGAAAMRTVIACLVFLLLPLGNAQAGPLDEARVKARLATIARGEVDALMADYTDDCVYQWVGGALDGVYRGKAEIRALWAKFAQNQGPMELTLGKVESNTNPKGVTVIASAQYKGKLEVKVRQVFVYRDGKLAMEIWQIDPSLNLAP